MEKTKSPPSKIVKYGGGFIAVTFTLAIAAMVLLPKNAPAPAAQQQPQPQAPDPAVIKAQAIADAVVKSYGSRPNIERVDIRDVRANNYTYEIWYKKAPTYTEAKSDTSELIRSTLKKAIAPGTSTEDNWIFIHAHAYMRAKGETRDMVRVLGKATYNFNQDSIEFEVEK